MRSALTLLGAIIAAACAKEPATEHVRIDGSPGVLPLAQEIGLAYQKRTPGWFVIAGKGLGSAARLEALVNDSIDIALASHGVDSTELAGKGMTVHHIADVPVGFAVNSSVTVTDITEAQACDIYRGRIRNWRELGGTELPIVAVTRPKGEVDGDVMLAGIPCLGTLTMAPTVVSQQLPADMSNFVASTPGAIGMMSATMVAVAPDLVKPLSLGGVAPTPENLATGKYRLLRHSYFVTKALPAPGVQAFLDFIRSEAGIGILRSQQAVPRGH
jgi:phosphate transport system substrate-binding protein